MIIFLMLPRQLTLPRHLPVELTSSLPYSCSLLCAPKKANSHQISSFQPLFAKHPGGGVHPHHPILLAPAIACTTRRLYPLGPQPVAHTSRRHRGVLPPSSFVLQVFRPEFRFLGVLCFHKLTNPFSRKPFRFTSIQIPWGRGITGAFCLGLGAVRGSAARIS
jgi:hypothetical protein